MIVTAQIKFANIVHLDIDLIAIKGNTITIGEHYNNKELEGMFEVKPSLIIKDKKMWTITFTPRTWVTLELDSKHLNILMPNKEH